MVEGITTHGRRVFAHLSSSKRLSIRNFALAGVLSLLIIQLNIYFAWTSHVGVAVTKGLFYSGTNSTPLRSFLVNEVNEIVEIQLRIPGLSSFFTNLASKSAYHGGGGGHFGGGGFNGGGSSFFGGGSGFLFFGGADSMAMKYFIDTEVILFTLAIFLISLFLFQRSGIGVSLLRALEITSLATLPLGLEIFFFDRFEFNMHASDIQVRVGLAWFTNADVLILSSAILGITLFVEASRHAGRKSYNAWLLSRTVSQSV